MTTNERALVMHTGRKLIPDLDNQIGPSATVDIADNTLPHI